MSPSKSITSSTDTRATPIPFCKHPRPKQGDEQEVPQVEPLLQVHTQNGTKIMEVCPPRGGITATNSPQSCTISQQRQAQTATTPSASPNVGGGTSNNNLSNTTQCNTQLVEDTSLTAASYYSCYDEDLVLQQSASSIPWARITNTSSTAPKHWDLLPRPSNDTNTTTTTTATLFMGLPLLKGQIFNEYTLGRSVKVDLLIEPLPKAPAQQTESTQQELLSSSITSKVHSMISNRHAKIYCLFLGNNQNMEVYIEDTSGNGTLINSTVKLRKGEKRLLHSGDAICFVNPQIVYGLIQTTTTAAPNTTSNGITNQWKQQLHRDIIQHYSFHFVQLYTAAATISTINPCMTAMLPPPNRFAASSPSPPLNTIPPSTPMAEQSIVHTHPNNSLYTNNQINTTSSSKKKKKNYHGEGIVNVKAVQSPSQQLQKHTADAQARLESPKKINNKPNIMTLFPLPTKRKIQQQQQQQLATLTFEQQYDLREILGSGTCGQVRRAIHRKTGKVVAVKIIPIKKQMPKKKRTDIQRHIQPPSSKSDVATSTTSTVTTTAEQEAIQAEATLLQSLSHPYIVQMYDLHVDQRYVYIVMELVEGGDLLDRIVTHGCYSERGARQIMRRLLSALVYLHSQRIVHRDLKPENILVPPLATSTKGGVVSPTSQTAATPSNTTMIKITDFGLAKQLTEDGLAKTFCGTPQYFAPEVLQRQNTISTGWYGGPAADCWSLGVILYILLSGYQPFDYSINPNHLITCGSWEIDFSDPVWQPISRSAKDLITRLLCTDAAKRITAKEACAHEWILIHDGDTHTHPLDDPLLAKHQQKDIPLVEIKEQKDPGTDNTVNLFPSATPSNKKNCAYKNSVLDAVTADHHDDDAKKEEDDDELLSDFSDDGNVDSTGKNDIVKSKRKGFFWRPDKLKARSFEEHVGEEQNLAP